MPAEVIEQPPKADTPYVPPQVPEPPKLKVKAGDIFRQEFAKLEKAEAPEKPSDTPPAPEPVKEEPKPADPLPQPTEEKKPESPLDVVTQDQKPVVEVEEDVLKDFDEKNPDWKRARELIKTQRKEQRELTAQIEELKKSPKTDPDEIVRLAAERDALKASLSEREELIKSVDVRLSGEYRETLQKRDGTLHKIASRAKSYGVDPEALISALSLPEGKFKTDQIKMVMQEVDTDDRVRITGLFETLDNQNEALMEFERDAPKKYEEIQTKREAQIREQQENSVKAIQSEFGKLTEVLPKDVVTLREVPEDVPGGTEWNQAIKSAKETALRVLSPGGSDFNETGAIALKGAHYDSLVKMYMKDHTELVETRKRLAEYDNGGPDFKGGNKPKTEAKLTPTEKYYRSLNAAKSVSND